MKNLFLIGYRGTGKSTVARLVAAGLGWRAVDADALLEERFGTTIREMFAAEGEPGFRARESEVLADICRGAGQVVATGGGVILRDDNRERMAGCGKAVWLRADAATIHARLSGDATTHQRRPDLTVGGLAEVEELLRAREPLYTAAADREVDTAGRTPEQVAAEILAWLQGG